MFSIIYDENDAVLLAIQNFIDSYQEENLKLFFDTGLYYEDLIRKNYIENAKSFKKEIFDTIDGVLIGENILGEIPLDNNEQAVYMKIQNFRIKIFYRELFEQKIRLNSK